MTLRLATHSGASLDSAPDCYSSSEEFLGVYCLPVAADEEGELLVEA